MTEKQLCGNCGKPIYYGLKRWGHFLYHEESKRAACFSNRRKVTQIAEPQILCRHCGKPKGEHHKFNDCGKIKYICNGINHMFEPAQQAEKKR